MNIQAQSSNYNNHQAHKVPTHSHQAHKQQWHFLETYNVTRPTQLCVVPNFFHLRGHRPDAYKHIISPRIITPNKEYRSIQQQLEMKDNKNVCELGLDNNNTYFM